MSCRRFFLVFAGVLLLSSTTAARADVFDWSQGWREVAHFSGAIPVTAANYTNGLGVFTDAEYAQALGAFDYADSAVVVAVTMGAYTDYFRPGPGVHRVRDMMTANNRHLWSSSPAGPWLTPTYYTSGLGGSGVYWPPPTRMYLSFWGGGPAGGCCHASPGDVGAWNRAFRVYLQVPMESLSVAVEGNGAVERAPDRATFPSDSLQVVTLTAVPEAGWAFAGWSGDTTAAANPISLAMGQDRSLTATFVATLDANEAAGRSRSGITLVTPNPARGAVTVEYAVAREAHVRMSVHDVKGRLVRRLVDGSLAPGRYRATWEGAGPRGHVPAGTYFVRFEAGEVRSSRRLVLTD